MSLLLCSTFISPSHASDVFPSKTVRIVVPYTAGGATDIAGRTIAKALSAQFKQAVIVENKPGGMSTIGTNYVVRQPADGYTLVLVAGHIVTNPATGVSTPYDALKDLDPIINLASLPIIVGVNPNVPVESLSELVKWIGNQTKPVMYATPGAGSLAQLWGALFAQHYKLNLQGLPYKGSSEVARAVVSNEAPMLVDVGGISGTMVGQGKIRGILTTSTTAVPGLESLLTAKSAGLPRELESHSFLGLLGARQGRCRLIHAAKR